METEQPLFLNPEQSVYHVNKKGQVPIPDVYSKELERLGCDSLFVRIIRDSLILSPYFKIVYPITNSNSELCWIRATKFVHKLAIGSQNRIMLPHQFRKDCLKESNEVIYTGRGYAFTLWTPQKYFLNELAIDALIAIFKKEKLDAASLNELAKKLIDSPNHPKANYPKHVSLEDILTILKNEQFMETIDGNTLLTTRGKAKASHFAMLKEKESHMQLEFISFY